MRLAAGDCHVPLAGLSQKFHSPSVGETMSHVAPCSRHGGVNTGKELGMAAGATRQGNARAGQRLRSAFAGALAFGSLLGASLALTGCNQVFTVAVDGSSTVFPISEAAAESYEGERQAKLRVTVAESGTGGGFKKFCRGDIHVQGASRPILKREMEECRKAGIRYVELPVAFDALSVVVHPDNALQSITVEQLKVMWSPDAQGKIDDWRDVDPAFPNLPLTLYGPGTASGTFDYFTEAVVGKAKSSRTDFTPSEDDNLLVQGISSDRGALGYFGMSYYTANKGKVRALGISYKGGPPVYPTAETVQSGAYQPLARPLFIYVRADALDLAPVRAFVLFYLDNAPRLAAEVGFVGLPPQAYEIGRRRVIERQTGTGFSGAQDVGGNIKEILARPLTDAPPAPDAPPAKTGK
jgi:phosphate transport system substrate-binding protein